MATKAYEPYPGSKHEASVKFCLENKAVLSESALSFVTDISTKGLTTISKKQIATIADIKDKAVAEVTARKRLAKAG